MTVTAVKSTDWTGPTTLTVIVDGKKLTKTLNVHIKPADLHHAKIVSDLAISSSADYDYVFEVMPFDIYNNIALVTDD